MQVIGLTKYRGTAILKGDDVLRVGGVPKGSRYARQLRRPGSLDQKIVITHLPIVEGVIQMEDLTGGSGTYRCFRDHNGNKLPSHARYIHEFLLGLQNGKLTMFSGPVMLSRKLVMSSGPVMPPQNRMSCQSWIRGIFGFTFQAGNFCLRPYNVKLMGKMIDPKELAP